MRFAVLRVFLPAAAIAAANERAARWWDDFVTVVGAMFDPVKRRQWLDEQRAETLDADQIEAGGHGGFAAGSGGDEG